MNFTPIDMKTWPRAQMFVYFSNIAPTGYSLTVNIDVTNLQKTLKKRGLKFFPAYLWLVTRNLNKQPEFKVAKKGDMLGYYDKLTPLYATFHEDDKTFSLMYTDYTDNFMDFYEAYIQNQQEYADTHGVISTPMAPPPENAYTVSCLPWISFSAFNVISYKNTPYYFPSIEAGKFIKENGRTLLPLSITCHHATTDGYHVKVFLENLEEDIRNFSCNLLE